MPVQEGTIDGERVFNYLHGQVECDGVGPIFIMRCVSIIRPPCQWNQKSELPSLCLNLKHGLRDGTRPSSFILVVFPRLSRPAIGSLPP